MRGGGQLDRAQRVLWLVAEHGVLDTTQVAVLLGVSRPTAHRVLDALANAEVLGRHREHQGRDHRWSYQLSWSGRREVTRARRRAKLPLLSELSRRTGSRGQQRAINGFFVDLVSRAATSGGRAGLVTWRHRIDARRWLEETGVTSADCDGLGVWIEDGATVRFVLLWLTWWEADSAVLAILSQAWPGVDTVLVVTASPVAERQAMAHAATASGPVAFTTRQLLAAEGPAGPIWAVGAGDHPRRRLADLGPRRTT